LAVGANGETLVADSSTSTGLRYQGTMAAGRNFVINGGFDIWQRGTSFATGALNYFADRWQSARIGQAAGMTISRQVTNDTTNLPFIQYCARVQRDSGNTSNAANFINTIFETVNSIPLAGKTVTLSFYARAGANYSTASNALTSRLITGTGTDQNNFSSTFTGQANAIQVTNNTLTTTWQRFQATATLGGTITQLAVQFESNPSGTAGANDWFEVTGVQVEVGAVATQFSRAGATIQGELAAAQRYYARIGFPYLTNNAPGFCTGRSYSTTAGDAIIPLSVPLRTVAASVDYSGLQFNDQNNTTYSITSVSLNSNQQPNIGMITFGSSGMTASRMGWIIGTSGANTCYIGFSAEL
jgi:hypothetical protein